jgi:hypothetical protein
MSDKYKLFILAKSSTYEALTSEMLNLIDSMSEHDPIVMLNLAKNLRKQEDNRLTSIHLLVETAMAMSRRIQSLPSKERTSQPSLLSEWVPEIVIDVEDVLEALSYYIKKNGSAKKIPLSLKRGLAKVLGKFPELFNSYLCQKKGLTLHDAIKILHPKMIQYCKYNLKP